MKDLKRHIRHIHVHVQVCRVATLYNAETAPESEYKFHLNQAVVYIGAVYVHVYTCMYYLRGCIFADVRGLHILPYAMYYEHQVAYWRFSVLV